MLLLGAAHLPSTHGDIAKYHILRRTKLPVKGQDQTSTDEAMGASNYSGHQITWQTALI
jgi:hypothetical protein